MNGRMKEGTREVERASGGEEGGKDEDCYRPMRRVIVIVVMMVRVRVNFGDDVGRCRGCNIL